MPLEYRSHQFCSLEFGRLNYGQSVNGRHFIEASLKSSFCGGTVITNNKEDQCVVEYFQILESVNNSSHTMVSLLQESGINIPSDTTVPVSDCQEFHCRPEFLYAFQTVLHFSDGRASSAWQRSLLSAYPTLIKLSLFVTIPGNMMRSVGCTGRIINKEGLIGRHCFLLTDITAHP